MNLTFGRILLALLLMLAVPSPGLLGAQPPGERPHPDLIAVKGGCFQMGDVLGDGDADEKPVHEVCVDDFLIGRTEVTRAEFGQFVEASGYRTDAEKGGGCISWNGKDWKREPGQNWRNPGFAQTGTHPVTCVSWNDAEAYLAWLSKTAGEEFRLPTEAEWEYAARSGGKKIKFSSVEGASAGNVSDHTIKGGRHNILSGTTTDPFLFTAPSASFAPNELGLNDMSGNVWEWVQDRYRNDYYGASPRNNPTGPSRGRDHVLRGGSWSDSARSARTTNRGKNVANAAFSFNGFRIAASAKGNQQDQKGSRNESQDRPSDLKPAGGAFQREMAR
jgi:formylglycine-generating enzyme required for sulfatase activity